MAQGSPYSDEQRREAAVLLAVHGTAEHVSKLTGIPPSTLRDWTKQDWFKPIVAEVRRQNALEMDAAFTRVLVSASVQIQDRIEHGDVVLTKDGTQVRRPMSGKDLAVVAGIVHDKRERARSPAGVIADISTTDQKEELFQLAEFMRWQARQGGVGEKLPN